MHRIDFKRQAEGMWRRDDGKTKALVTAETMNREVEKLENEGWKVELHGYSILRGVTLTRYKKFP